MKQGSATSRIISVVLGLFLCAYIGYQAWRSLYNPVRTVSAVFAEVDDSVQMDGYIVRNEKSITGSYGSGVLEMNLYEGERAASGSAVAVVYADEASALKSRNIQELDEQIDRITTLYSQSGETYDLNAINNSIAEYTCRINDMIQDGMFYNIDSKVEELKLETMLREYIYRDKSELVEVIDELKAEREKLGRASEVKKRIYTQRAGYFSHSTDGYESVLNSGVLEKATPNEFLSVCEAHAIPDADTVGKLIESNKWYFAAVIGEADAQRLKVGNSMVLKFQEKSLPDVTAEVWRVSEPEEGKKLVVFECNTHVSDFTKVRKVTAQAVIKTYSGLKVPREALRVDDEGRNGVYCLIESQVKFKPIEISFEKDSYYISKYDSSDTKSLLLYDEIVISAKNLEHKKVIK